MRLDIRPRGLLEVASLLAYEGVSDPGRPGNARLRMAVSAAYYALFHAVALAVVEHVLPSGVADERRRLARSVDHKAVTTVCTWVAGKATGPEHAQPTIERAASSPQVVDVAALLPDLQEARFGADYDHTWEVSKVAALDWVQHSRRAVDRLADLTAARSPAVHAFLGLIALRTPTVR